MKSPGILYYFTFIMSFLYLAVGGWFILSDYAAEIAPGWRHGVLGTLFIFYAGYRFIRLKRLKAFIEKEHEL